MNMGGHSLICNSAYGSNMHYTSMRVLWSRQSDSSGVQPTVTWVLPCALDMRHLILKQLLQKEAWPWVQWRERKGGLCPLEGVACSRVASEGQATSQGTTQTEDRAHFWLSFLPGGTWPSAAPQIHWGKRLHRAPRCLVSTG